MVTLGLGVAEARYFRDFYPDARVITLTYLDRPVYVLTATAAKRTYPVDVAAPLARPSVLCPWPHRLEMSA